MTTAVVVKLAFDGTREDLETGQIPEIVLLPDGKRPEMVAVVVVFTILFA